MSTSNHERWQIMLFVYEHIADRIHTTTHNHLPPNTTYPTAFLSDIRDAQAQLTSVDG